jgi:hypothetical protein
MRKFLVAIMALIAAPAIAADLPIKAPAAAVFSGYPYTSCGVYFGIDTQLVSGSASQGEIGALIGYSCPLGPQAFWFAEGIFNFANLNSTQNGINLDGPASFEQRLAVGTPINNVLNVFPSLGLTLPTLPILPSGVTVTTSHPYMFVAFHEQDIGVSSGLGSFREFEFSPGAGIGVLNQLSNGVALDVFAEVQFLDKAFCAPVAGGCNSVGTLGRAGLALKY